MAIALATLLVGGGALVLLWVAWQRDGSSGASSRSKDAGKRARLARSAAKAAIEAAQEIAKNKPGFGRR